MNDCCKKRLFDLKNKYGKISTFECNICEKLFINSVSDGDWVKVDKKRMYVKNLY